MKYTQNYKFPYELDQQSARDNQKLSKLLREEFERLKDQIIGMNMKQKVTIKIRQTNFDIYSNQILVELIKDLFEFTQLKLFLLKDLNLRGITYQN